MNGLHKAESDDLVFRTMFLSGLGLGAFAATTFGVGAVVTFPAIGLAKYVAAGALVGVGTNVGHGCTSGHGICGLGRLSPRSFVNVLSFMTGGFVTAYLLYDHAGSFSVAPLLLPSSTQTMQLLTAGVAMPVLALTLAAQLKNVAFSALAIGTTFGVGLSIGGMVSPAKVINFLNVLSPSGWDPSLMCVMGGGLLVSFASYQYQASMSKPIIVRILSIIIYRWNE